MLQGHAFTLYGGCQQRPSQEVSGRWHRTLGLQHYLYCLAAFIEARAALMRLQALEDEKLGPRKPGVQSYERRKRLAVQEAATALACTLMPSIEPVELVRALF